MLNTRLDIMVCFFPSYKTRPAIYDNIIGDDAKAGVCAKLKARYTAKLEDWKIFYCAQRELHTFIFSCVDDKWIQELQDSVTGYDYVPPRDIMTYL